MFLSVYLKRSGAELQALLHVLLQLILDADLLLFGERRHWEGSDHRLLAHWTKAGNTNQQGITEKTVLCCTKHS